MSIKILFANLKKHKMEIPHDWIPAKCAIG
jgi:hypothetical protein